MYEMEIEAVYLNAKFVEMEFDIEDNPQVQGYRFKTVNLYQVLPIVFNIAHCAGY